MNPELERQIREGQLKMMQKMPPEKRPAIDRTPLNPVPDTTEGLKVLQQLHNCPLDNLTRMLNAAIHKAQAAENIPEVERLYKSTVYFIPADLNCRNGLKKRIVVEFSADEELNAMTQQMAAIECEALALRDQLIALEQQYDGLEEARFHKAVDKYGLNLKDRSYQVDNETCSINLIEPQCLRCIAVDEIKKALDMEVKTPGLISATDLKTALKSVENVK